MKKTKTLISMLAAAAILFLLPYCNSLKASADEPVTYAVKYLPDEEDWRYQADTSTFNEENPHRELYYLQESLKDGDLVVVYNPTDSSQTVDLGTKRLSNLTVVETKGITIINTGGVDECYVLANNSVVINGNVTKAFVYDYALCNFNNNVTELTIYAGDDVFSDVGCSGTVGHLYVPSTTMNHTFYDLYNFQANSLSMEDGVLLTSDTQYSSSPSAGTAPAPTAAPQTPASSSANNSEYDSVPKTGEFNPVPWLSCIAALCAAGSLKLKTKKQ